MSTGRSVHRQTQRQGALKPAEPVAEGCSHSSRHWARGHAWPWWTRAGRYEARCSPSGLRTGSALRMRQRSLPRRLRPPHSLAASARLLLPVSRAAGSPFPARAVPCRRGPGFLPSLLFRQPLDFIVPSVSSPLTPPTYRLLLLHLASNSASAYFSSRDFFSFFLFSVFFLFLSFSVSFFSLLPSPPVSPRQTPTPRGAAREPHASQQSSGPARPPPPRRLPPHPLPPGPGSRGSPDADGVLGRRGTQPLHGAPSVLSPGPAGQQRCLLLGEQRCKNALPLSGARNPLPRKSLGFAALS